MNSIVDKLLENRNLENKKRFYNLVQFYLMVMKSTRKQLNTLESNAIFSGLPSSITNLFGSMQALVLLMEIEFTDFDKFMKEEMNITGDEINSFKESMNGILETQISVSVSPTTFTGSIPVVPPPHWSSVTNPTYQFQCNHMHDTFPMQSSGPQLSPSISDLMQCSGSHFPPQLYNNIQMPKMPKMPKMPYDDPSPPTTPKFAKHPYHKMASEEMEECLESPLPPSPIIKHKISKKLPKDWKKAVPSYDLPKKKHTLKKHVKHPKFIDDSEDTLSEDKFPTKQTENGELHVEI
jgi:hypothetical protein